MISSALKFIYQGNKGGAFGLRDQPGLKLADLLIHGAWLNLLDLCNLDGEPGIGEFADLLAKH